MKILVPLYLSFITYRNRGIKPWDRDKVNYSFLFYLKNIYRNRETHRI